MKHIDVLIADDHPLIRKGVINALKDYADIRFVGEATDGYQALEMVRKFDPSILLLDIDMPKLSGLDVLKKVKEDQKESLFLRGN
mgnify:CR=1 FL=1